MTSSDNERTELPERDAIEAEAYRYIKLLDLSRLAQPDQVELLIFFALIERTELQAVDQLPTLIRQATKRPRSYRILMGLSAKYLEAGADLPPELDRWLIGHLRGDHTAPKRGLRGPNKSDMEDYWLKVTVESLANKFGVAIYPTETGEQDLRILACYASASRKFAKELGSSPYPKTTQAMKNRYLKARKWWEVGLCKADFEKI